MRLLLVRHGETEWNVAGRVQGSSDIPLNRTGMEQARRLHDRLASISIDAVYTSDLGRCVETARLILGARPLRVRLTTNLREINYGELEGKNRRELEAAGYGPWLTAWNGGGPCRPPVGGESREQVDLRVDHFLSCVALRHVDETVLVVSHGGPLRLLMARLMGRPVTGWGEVRQANTALNEVILIPGHDPRIVRMNDTSHLDGTALAPAGSSIQGTTVAAPVQEVQGAAPSNSR